MADEWETLWEKIFAELPETIQDVLQELGFFPEYFDVGEDPYTPEWATSWQHFGRLGFWAPASLAPYYLWGGISRAYRAGWIPTEWAGQPEAGFGQYTYTGREAKAAAKASSYERDYLATGKAYLGRQAALWGGRAAYWSSQQTWSPFYEAWTATRLLSYMDPTAFMIRALGFPFFQGLTRTVAGMAQAPYVQSALKRGATYEQILNISSFFAGRYPTLSEQMVAGVGEWTVAQVGLWTALAPRGQRWSTLKGALPLSLLQPGLSMILDPLSTMATRSLWGMPMFINEEERRSVQAQMLIGGIFATAGTAGMIYQRLKMPTYSPFGVPWSGLQGAIPYGPFRVDPMTAQRMIAALERYGGVAETSWLRMPMPAMRVAASRPVGWRYPTMRDYYGFLSDVYGQNAEFFEQPRFGYTWEGAGYGRAMWTEATVAEDAGLMRLMIRRPQTFAQPLALLGSLLGIPAFWAAEMFVQSRRWEIGKKDITDIVRTVVPPSAGFGGSYVGMKGLSAFAPALEEMLSRSIASGGTLAKLAPWIRGVGTVAGLAADIAFPILIGTWAYAEFMRPYSFSKLVESYSGYTTEQLQQMYAKGQNMPGGWSGVPGGYEMKQALEIILIQHGVGEPRWLSGIEASYGLGYPTDYRSILAEQRAAWQPPGPWAAMHLGLQGVGGTWGPTTRGVYYGGRMYGPTQITGSYTPYGGYWGLPNQTYTSLDIPGWMFGQSGNLVDVMFGPLRDRDWLQNWVAGWNVFNRWTVGAGGQLTQERRDWGPQPIGARYMPGGARTEGTVWAPTYQNPYAVGTKEWGSYARAWGSVAGSWVWQGNQLIWVPGYQQGRKMEYNIANMQEAGLTPNEVIEVLQLEYPEASADLLQYMVHRGTKRGGGGHQTIGTPTEEAWSAIFKHSYTPMKILLQKILPSELLQEFLALTPGKQMAWAAAHREDIEAAAYQIFKSDDFGRLTRTGVRSILDRFAGLWATLESVSGVWSSGGGAPTEAIVPPSRTSTWWSWRNWTEDQYRQAWSSRYVAGSVEPSLEQLLDTLEQYEFESSDIMRFMEDSEVVEVFSEEMNRLMGEKS